MLSIGWKQMVVINCPACDVPPIFKIIKEENDLYATVECTICGVNRGHFKLNKPLSMVTNPENIRDLAMKRQKAYILWNKTFMEEEDYEMPLLW